MASLLKYLQSQEFNRGGQLLLGRARQDGMPFRGQSRMLRDEEYDNATQVVHDGHVRFFDLSNPADSRTLNEVVDQAANGWFQILKLTEHFVNQPDGTARCYVYCCWIEPYREIAEQQPAL